MRPWISLGLSLWLAGCGLFDNNNGPDGNEDPLIGDVDGDGLSGEEEADLGTDPQDPDSDDDGLTDGREVNETRTDPLDADSDDDGLTDGAEVDVHGTKPNQPDTDRDGLLDGDEINTHGSDPTLTDTDGDGLTDEEEVVLYGTDPASADSDSDGLTDEEEIDDWASDPLDADTDGDGIDDAEELNTYATDPTLVDTDGDTLSDPDELFVHETDPNRRDTDGDLLNDNVELEIGSDPFDPDTDDDGLTDAREYREHLTDFNDRDTDDDGLEDGDEVAEGCEPRFPDTDDDGLDDGDEVIAGSDCLIWDTDRGGISDGQEVNQDGTDPTLPADDVCDNPSVSVVDTAYTPTGPTFFPTFATFAWEMAFTANGGADIAEDSDLDGVITADEERSATLRIDLYGHEWEPLCSVTFDADRALPARSGVWLPTDWDGNGLSASVLERFDLRLADGITDCPPLDAGVYGSTDVRTVLADLDWGFALGDLSDVGPLLDEVATDAGLDYAIEVEPYVLGSWITWDRDEAHLSGYGFLNEAACGTVHLDDDGNPIRQLPLDPLTPGVMVSGWESLPELATTYEDVGPDAFFTFDEMTDVDCGRADVELQDSTWSTGTNAMGATSARILFDAVIDKDGHLGDFTLDDGTNPPTVSGANLTFVYEDDAGNELCRLVYDAEIGEELEDPSDWPTIELLTLGPAEDLTRAWTLDLVDGSGTSNCGTLSTTFFSFSDPELHVTSYDWGIGFGPISGPMASQAAIEIEDWDEVQDTTYGFFVTLDRLIAVEIGWAQSFDVNDCYVADPNTVQLPRLLGDRRNVQVNAFESINVTW